MSRFNFDPNHAEGGVGGANGPQLIKMIISLQPIVQLTSNLAIFLNLSIIRSIAS